MANCGSRNAINLSQTQQYRPAIFNFPYGRSKLPKLPIVSFVVIFPILSIPSRGPRATQNANAISLGDNLRHAAQTKTDLEFG